MDLVRTMRRLSAVFWFQGLLALSTTAAEAPRKEIRVLYDFEDPAEIAEFRGFADEGVFVEAVQDNGVTSGRTCMRVVGKEKEPWAALLIRGDRLRNWGDFEHFAMDVFSERQEKVRICFELWDTSSRDYQTRCTYEAQIHEGRNQLVWCMNRAKRNSKEGRSWEELEPKDKIRLDDLKMVKIFFIPLPSGGDTVLWIDRLRILQEDALGGTMQVELPDGAMAFDFGGEGTTVPGFTWVGETGKGVSGAGVKEVGSVWPDPLSGDGLTSSQGEFRFEVAMPDGEYWVWVNTGRVVDETTRSLPYLLRVGDQTLVDERVDERDFYGRKGLFRHLETQYSERPNALWLDYVEPVLPSRELRTKVSGGKLTVQVCNHRLTALVVLPVARRAAFTEMRADLRRERIATFYSPLYFDKHEKPRRQTGPGPYLVWSPAAERAIRPWSGPSREEADVRGLDLRGARGQRLVFRACVTAFEDLGNGDISVSDLKGAGGVLPSRSIRAYYQNYRVQGTDVGEMALVPKTRIRFETGITWAYWFWLRIPDDATPGTYEGALTFTPDRGDPMELAVRLEVYPFALESVLPVSYGMYYGMWDFPEGIDRRRKALEQHRFMREIGFTATCVGSGVVRGLGPGSKVRLSFDPTLYEIAREVGMGRHPEQRMMTTSLGMARAIARRLGLSPAVDRNPGIEFSKPELKGYYQDAIRQLRTFTDRMGLPVAVEVVDEPRETPNPWNRNLEQTCTYADWLREAGSPATFVTPMGDTNQGRDYTGLVDHVDIVSVHATSHSKRMIQRTRAQRKTLWFYNTGMDRFSWGFYNWRMGSKGRWEWHWSWGGGDTEGYPNPAEWYTPFTGRDGYAVRAPYWEYPGGMLFKSALLHVAGGITDYAYLVTLEKAIASSRNAEAATRAREFLSALREAIPEWPDVGGLASADAGALVGTGIGTHVAGRAEEWRREIASLIIALE